MVRGLEAVLLSSEDAKKLADFYQNTLGIKITEEYEDEDGNSYFEMEVGEGSSFYINSHSEVKGTAKEPQRIMLNFEVNDAEAAAKEAEGKGAKKIADVYHIEGYGHVSTFADPDGNYFQLVQVRASEKDHDHEHDHHEDHDNGEEE